MLETTPHRQRRVHAVATRGGTSITAHCGANNMGTNTLVAATIYRKRTPPTNDIATTTTTTTKEREKESDRSIDLLS